MKKQNQKTAKRDGAMELADLSGRLRRMNQRREADAKDAERTKPMSASEAQRKLDRLTARQGIKTRKRSRTISLAGRVVR